MFLRVRGLFHFFSVGCVLISKDKAGKIPIFIKNRWQVGKSLRISQETGNAKDYSAEVCNRAPWWSSTRARCKENAEERLSEREKEKTSGRETSQSSTLWTSLSIEKILTFPPPLFFFTINTS